MIGQLRETALARVLPSPLDDSPKCPRCSLVGICLPDETRLLQEKQSATRGQQPAISGQRTSAQATNDQQPATDNRQPATDSVRRLMPARDDALPLYVQEQGATIGKSGDQLTVKTRDKPVRQVRLLDVSQVCVLGNVQVTAQALRELSAAGIPIGHFSYGGWFHAMTVGMTHKNVELRIAQYAAAADPGRSLAIARQFVLGKIKNCRTLLRRNLLASDRKAEAVPAQDTQDGDEPGSSGPLSAVGCQLSPENTRDGLETGPAPNDTPGGAPPRQLPPDNGQPATDNRQPATADRQPPTADPRREVLAQLAGLIRRAESARDAASLLGIEGMAAKDYFAGFARLLKGGDEFVIEGRNRRPPRDPVNALLSFVYALVVKDVTLAVQAVGFDPMLGFYHRPRYGRPSLALDLAEEFRPLVADSTVLTLVNNGEVTASSFIRRGGSGTDRRGPSRGARGVRAPHGHAGHAPVVRLPHQLPPRAGGAGPAARPGPAGRDYRVSRLLHTIGGMPCEMSTF